MPEKETLPLSKIEHSKISKNHLILVFIICVTLIIIFYFMFSNSKGSNVIQESKKDCPYECCLEGDYNLNNCDSLYECLNNNCKPIDSDKDGLTDLEENNIGTNPQMYDTDGDTLNDYQEYKILRTNPLDSNTDKDRYKDNEDKNPLVRNSAVITTQILNKEWNWKYTNIVLAFVGGGIINPEMVIAEPTINVIISNNGDDYTSYANFDIAFQLQNTEIDRKRVLFNQINVGDTKSEIYKREIRANQVPSMLWDLATKQSTDWDIKIDNLDYEQY